MKQLKKITILAILLLIAFCPICFAQSEMRIVPNKETIKQEEKINIAIELSNVRIAAGTLEIYFDFEKLEYLQGPENSNFSNRRILYTWVSSSGKNEQTIKIGDFVFQALQNGMANIVVIGEFYNESGERVEIDNSNLQLLIGKQEIDINPIISEQKPENIATYNTSLSILRLNHEGISPDFRKDIKEYYFIADTTIDSLEITAIPESPNATITITGNRNLKIGKNTITIHVVSEDKTQETDYQIYVTKTKNVEMANANLENLAVREENLIPEFEPNQTNYKLEIPNEIEKINILAIPQSTKAQVSIIGNDQMKIGNNTIQINVLAEDKITNKKYEITVHRRNEQEELQYKQEREDQAQKLSVILEKEEENDNTNEIKQKEKRNILSIVIVIVLGSSVITGIVYIVKKRKKY